MRHKKTNEELNALFGFQNMGSRTFEGMEQICEDYFKNGLFLTISKAYFYGLVDGKRQERLKRKNSIIKIEKHS